MAQRNITFDRTTDRRKNSAQPGSYSRAYPPVIHPYPTTRSQPVRGTSTFPTPARDSSTVSQVAVLKWNMNSPKSQHLLNQLDLAKENIWAGPTQTSLPDPQIWSENCARVIIDILSGRRNLSSLRRWLDMSLYRRLEARISSRPPEGEPSFPALTKASRLCQISPTAYECAVVVMENGRARAVAMRINAFRNRWMITALEVG